MFDENYFGSEYVNQTTLTYSGVVLWRQATQSYLSIALDPPLLPAQANEYVKTHFSGWDVEYYL